MYLTHKKFVNAKSLSLKVAWGECDWILKVLSEGKVARTIYSNVYTGKQHYYAYKYTSVQNNIVL